MAKISNTTVYPTVTPADDDLLILTDATDSNRTKTVKMSGVKSYLNVDTFTATGTVTSTQILNSFTQPVILIPGVAGKHIVPISMVFTFVPNTTPYTTPNDALFTFGAPSSAGTWSRITNAYYAGLINKTAFNLPSSYNGFNNPGIYTTGAGGDNFLYSTTNANPTLGDGTFTYNIMYRLVNA